MEVKVFDQKGNNNWKPVDKTKEGELLDGTYIPGDGQNADIGMQKKGKGGDGSGDTTTMIIVVVVAALAFFLIKMRKKKKKK